MPSATTSRRVVVDNVESPEWDRIGPPVFSPDSRRLAYRGLIKDKAFAVIDGVASPAYDAVGPITFGPDSRHAIYVVKTGPSRPGRRRRHCRRSAI